MRGAVLTECSDLTGDRSGLLSTGVRGVNLLGDLKGDKKNMRFTA